MAGTIEAYLLALTSTMGQGIQAAPISTASTGTVTSGITETMDAVLGTYQWNAVAGRRYQVVMNGLIGSPSASGDTFTVRIRDSGTSSTPTTSSTVIAEDTWHSPAAGVSGRQPIPLNGTFIAGGSGTHTVAFFAVRTGGTGTFTPISAVNDGGSLSRELYVVDLGVF